MSQRQSRVDEKMERCLKPQFLLTVTRAAGISVTREDCHGQNKLNSISAS